MWWNMLAFFFPSLLLYIYLYSYQYIKLLFQLPSRWIIEESAESGSADTHHLYIFYVLCVGKFLWSMLTCSRWVDPA